jgi:hypothetical protein
VWLHKCNAEEALPLTSLGDDTGEWIGKKGTISRASNAVDGLEMQFLRMEMTYCTSQFLPMRSDFIYPVTSTTKTNHLWSVTNPQEFKDAPLHDYKDSRNILVVCGRCTATLVSHCNKARKCCVPVLIKLWLYRMFQKKSSQWYSKCYCVATVSRCWTMDSLYAFKCKRFRNTRHTVIFGISL